MIDRREVSIIFHSALEPSYLAYLLIVFLRNDCLGNRKMSCPGCPRNYNSCAVGGARRTTITSPSEIVERNLGFKRMIQRFLLPIYVVTVL